VRIETKLTDWLGRISYSIYLFHPIVFQPIYLWLMGQPFGSPFRTEHLAIYLAANVALTLVVASLVYRFVEQPAMRLGHRFASAWEERAAHARTEAPSVPATSRAIAEAAAG
jgi:peptidoglycan/LPS O-acetylase OafA/YrhL